MNLLVLSTLLVLSFAVIRLPVNRIEPSREFYRQLIRHQASLNSNDLKPIPIDSYEGVQYWADVDIGTPPQQFRCVLGISNLWVPSSKCHQASCLIHRRYHADKSETYQKNGTSFEIQYGSGGIEGYVSLDTVTLGDVSVTNYPFGEVTREKGISFLAGHFDGILGLAFKTISVHQIEPWWIEAYKQKQMEEPVFTWYLREENSEIVLGGEIPEFRTEPFFWVPLKQDLWWLIKIDSFSMPGETFVMEAEGIVDSGTSLLIGPKKVIDRIAWIIRPRSDCSNLHELPPLTFVINGKDFVLTPEDYVMQMGGQCLLGMQAMEIPGRENFFILGDVFMRNRAISFDGGKKRIGFAPSKQ
ncbi:hypothetical protein GEMRC1_009348 [Eukaryota sp. GEM-RC1]